MTGTVALTSSTRSLSLAAATAILGLLLATLVGCSGSEQATGSAATPTPATKSAAQATNGFGCHAMSPAQAEKAVTTAAPSTDMDCDVPHLVANLCQFDRPVVPATPTFQGQRMLTRWSPAGETNEDNSAVSEQRFDTGWMQLSCFNVGQRFVSLYKPEFISVLTGRCIVSGTAETELPFSFTAKVQCG